MIAALLRFGLNDNFGVGIEFGVLFLQFWELKVGLSFVRENATVAQL